MNFIDDFINFLSKHINKINFGKAYLYKLQEIDLSCGHELKYLEKRLLIQDISIDNIVDGRLTLSVPTYIAEKVSEIMVISE